MCGITELSNQGQNFFWDFVQKEMSCFIPQMYFCRGPEFAPVIQEVSIKDRIFCSPKKKKGMISSMTSSEKLPGFCVERL